MKKPVVMVILVALVAAGVFATRWWMSRDAAPADRLEVSGTVEATEARLGFQMAGRITEVLVREGDRVSAGAVLARLDASELQARRAQAAARIDAVNALLRELRTGSRSEEIATSSAGVEAAQVKLDDARRDVATNRKLFDGGAISREAYQKSVVAATVAEKQLEQARQTGRMVTIGPRQEKIDAQQAQVREATAALESVDALLRNTVITAPVSGVVTTRHREPNETVAPGQPVISLLDPNDRWVRVYVPEHQLGAVHVGAPATIVSDTYPDKRYSGHVVYVAEQAEFTPKNVQTREERVKLVYAVRVRIDGDARIELKPGLPVDVTVAVAK